VIRNNYRQLFIKQCLLTRITMEGCYDNKLLVQFQWISTIKIVPFHVFFFFCFLKKRKSKKRNWKSKSPLYQILFSSSHILLTDLSTVCPRPKFWRSERFCQKWSFWALQLWWTYRIIRRKWRFWPCRLFPSGQGLPQLHRMPRGGR